jgi:hypothetical protein
MVFQQDPLSKAQRRETSPWKVEPRRCPRGNRTPQLDLVADGVINSAEKHMIDQLEFVQGANQRINLLIPERIRMLFPQFEQRHSRVLRQALRELAHINRTKVGAHSLRRRQLLPLNPCN